MKSEIDDILHKAAEFYDDALWSIEGERYGNAVNRAYYAVFYCAMALLRYKDVKVKSHKGVRNQFGLIFIRTNVLPESLNSIINELADLRNFSDYNISFYAEREDAKLACEQAKMFLETTKEWLASQEEE